MSNEKIKGSILLGRDYVGSVSGSRSGFFLDSDPDPVISRMSDPDPGKTPPDPNPRFSLSIVSVLLTIFPFKEQSSSMNLTFLHSLRGVTVGLFLGL